MAKLSFLIIEDDKYMRLSLKEILREFGTVDEASDYSDGERKLLSHSFDVVISDIDLNGHSALPLFHLIRNKKSHCIVVSSQEEDETIEKAYALGASHFLSKDRIRRELSIYIQKFVQIRSNKFSEIIKKNYITESDELIEELAGLCDLNIKNKNLFISGETGTGKSHLAKIIHEMTHPDAPFVHLNCSEISESLLESELFGHEKGAFTGADSKKIGKLKLADGGTLFLDEVATMSLSMQQKLLKVLDDKTFYPVGSNHPEVSHFTLITATCENITQQIRDKSFREDLFYRISGFKFHVKSLRERRCDIRPLIKHYQKESSRKFVIKEEALSFLESYSWPGNIRELKLAVERISQIGQGIVTLQSIKEIISYSKLEENILNPNNDILRVGLKNYISNLEKQAVKESMERHKGKITACIKELKISASAFYRILNEI